MSKLTTCKTCGQKIAKSAKTCPHCGAKQHQGVYVVCVIIVIVAVFLCIAILNGGKSGQKANNSDVNNPTSETKVETKEQLIFQNDDLQIYFKGFAEAPAPAIGYYINLKIANNSDIDYLVQVDDMSVNDIMVPFANHIFSSEILSGKTANDKIWVTNTVELGIDWPISSAEFCFVLYKNGDFSNREQTDIISISE